jgi:hypothetical protein
MALEEHGSGHQLMRVRYWPHVCLCGVGSVSLVAALAAVVLGSGATVAALAPGSLALALVVRVLYECGTATATVKRALEAQGDESAQSLPAKANQPRLGLPRAQFRPN